MNLNTKEGYNISKSIEMMDSPMIAIIRNTKDGEKPKCDVLTTLEGKQVWNLKGEEDLFKILTDAMSSNAIIEE